MANKNSLLNIENLTVAPLNGSSLFVKPKEIHYTINGLKRKWDCIECHDSVAIIVFNVTRKVFVCVKQFRPAVYIHNIPKEDQVNVIDCNKYPPTLGYTLEFCAGIVDKNKPLEVIAKEELLEEIGYDVPLEKLEKIKIFCSNVGTTVEKINLFYAEVSDDMKVEAGGGIQQEGEYIEVVELSLEEAKQICDQQCVSNMYCGFLFGLLWFFHCKVKSDNFLL